MTKKDSRKNGSLLYVAITLLSVLLIVTIGIFLYQAMNTGVKGSVIVVEGDCMPPANNQCASESQNTRKMTVSLYQSANKSDDGSLTPSGKVATMHNVTNSYSLSAKPGKYFIFYRYNDSDDPKEYCAPVLQTTQSKQEPCEVIIPTTGMAKVNITFSFVTY